ncbi:hypothetical protein PILCRDRAFT_824206 [Piloderma croceum F 1598]|uniref:Uncharacterized protein n=1 Tax=Piloderma croceum (strain F 1598) TaxID=765440 RepID=A0A0C3AXR0_PILCF|nr:hypothetical protein PILCRDRAFT_824206 [Piloderma croceum F 1598]
MAAAGRKGGDLNLPYSISIWIFGRVANESRGNTGGDAIGCKLLRTLNLTLACILPPPSGIGSGGNKGM